jgi:phage regulator Rha-like protein
MKTVESTIISQELIQQKIYFLRGEKVIFDRDLAVLYGVETKVLNQAVTRNIKRFPIDFMFRLTKKETEIWQSQIVTLIRGKNIKYTPIVFTEQGVPMLSSVLKSERAIQVNVQIIRTFTQMRKIL